MAVYQVNSNGTAPSGLSAGDYVNTAGGMYMVTEPGALGSTYNPASGYWSVKADSSNAASSSVVQSVINSAQTMAQSNTEQSQAFAREQMAFQKEQNAKAMSFNAAEAEKNRLWQQEMSNTAHQREVRDLLAAGLNPVLSAMGGSGASTPSGATASGVTSAGASGQVDNSYLNLFAQIYGALVNRQTTLDVAQIQAAVNQYMSDNSLSAALGSASISAQGAYRVAEMNNQFSEYVKQNYPSDIAGYVNNLLHAVGDWANGSNSYNGVLGKILNGVVNPVRNSIKSLDEHIKNGKVGYAWDSGNKQ